MIEPRPHRPASDTREALLDAAEHVFAERGLRAASLRAITGAAGANLAAVHYHFGSKEGLVEALFARRLVPLNAERLAWLERCEADAAPEAPAVACLVRAFVAPVIRMMRDDEHGGRQFARIIGRAIFEPDPEYRNALVNALRPVVDRFVAAFVRACPELPEAEVYWRFHFMAGAMGRIASLSQVIAIHSGGLCDPEDVEGMIDHLVTFLAAAWEAAPTPAGREEGRKTGAEVAPAGQEPGNDSAGVSSAPPPPARHAGDDDPAVPSSETDSLQEDAS